MYGTPNLRGETSGLWPSTPTRPITWQGMSVILRDATEADVELLAFWDSQPHVIAASGADDDEDWSRAIATKDDATWLLVAELDDRPIGVVQIIDPAQESTHYWGEIQQTCGRSTSGSERNLTWAVAWGPR